MAVQSNFNKTLRPDASAQEVIDSLNTLIDAFNRKVPLGKIDSEMYRDFTSSVAWTGAVSNPAFGAATKLFRYQRLGRRIRYSGYLKMAADTTYGSGEWYFSLPVEAYLDATLALSPDVGSFYLIDANTGNRYTGVARIFNATNLKLTVSDDPAQNADVGQGVPITFTTNDIIGFSIEYEAKF